MPPFRRKRLGDGHGFDEAHEADQHGWQQQLLPKAKIEGRKRKGRQTGWDFTDDLYALLDEAEAQHGEDRQHNRGHWTGLCNHVRRARLQAARQQQGLEPFACPVQEGRRRAPDHHGERVDATDALVDPSH